MDPSVASLVDPINVLQSLPPSHIAHDGRVIYLPPTSDREKSIFFERTIAKHDLLADDITDKKPRQDSTTSTAQDREETHQRNDKQDDRDTQDTQDEDTPQVHPLALASAKLHGSGINELNKIINLNTLVASQNYFGLTNIVDPTTDPTLLTNKPSQSNNQEHSMQEEQKSKAAYTLKRKREQFQLASETLARHHARMNAAIAAQRRPDQRLRQLRPHWRLVAPEHGTRAQAHPTRPTELIAADVDIYFGTAQLGRLAARVPRYATIELQPDYNVTKDLEALRKGDQHKDDAGESSSQSCTRAEPFAIADPTLGKIDADFDPRKVTMLTLQFEIEKASTSFCQRARLEPAGSLSENAQDEQVLMALQHSLFCAKLFESIRRELAPDTEEVGQVRTSAKAQSLVWLSSTAEENYLPPPAQLASARANTGLAPLCVIHCHEGEVMVQLDCEYNLRVRLVEAGQELEEPLVSNTVGTISGSQSAGRLRALCRTLLLHAQEKYHEYSLKVASAVEQKDMSTDQLLQRRTELVPSPCILQSCVNLGSKLVFERRIRRTLRRVQEWLATKTEEPVEIVWLALSVFDPHAHFTLTFRDYTCDCFIAGDEITITSQHRGAYRKATFSSELPVELLWRRALSQQI